MGMDNVFLYVSRILWCALEKKEKFSCASVTHRGNISLRIFELIAVISIVNLINLGLVQSVQVKAYSPLL